MTSAASNYHESTAFIHQRYEDTALNIFHQQEKVRQDEKRRQKQQNNPFNHPGAAVKPKDLPAEFSRYGNPAVVGIVTPSPNTTDTSKAVRNLEHYRPVRTPEKEVKTSEEKGVRTPEGKKTIRTSEEKKTRTPEEKKTRTLEEKKTRVPEEKKTRVPEEKKTKSPEEKKRAGTAEQKSVSPATKSSSEIVNGTKPKRRSSTGSRRSTAAICLESTV